MYNIAYSLNYYYYYYNFFAQHNNCYSLLCFNFLRELNLSLIKSYVDFLLQQNVTQVFGKYCCCCSYCSYCCCCCCLYLVLVNGSTGESLSLTVVERKLIAEEWMKVAEGRLAIFNPTHMYM